MKNIRCLYCSSPDNSILFHALDFDTGTTRYTLARCSECNLIYTLDVTDKILEKVYSTKYYGSGDAKFSGIIEAILRLGHRNQAKKILRVFRADSTPADKPRILDIGCGRGLLLKEFQNLGASCMGLERDEFPLGENPKINIHIGSLSDEELAEEKFDIIVMWHVLEHIQDVSSMLNEIAKHLNFGGMLVVSVPNFSSWQSRFFKRNWFHLDLPRHVLHFEKNWLINSISEREFEIIDESTFSITQNLYGFIQSTFNLLLPSKPNRLYYLLINRKQGKNFMETAFWCFLAIFLFPVSIIEFIVSEKLKRGATLTMYFRYKSMDC